MGNGLSCLLSGDVFYEQLLTTRQTEVRRARKTEAAAFKRRSWMLAGWKKQQEARRLRSQRGGSWEWRSSKEAEKQQQNSQENVSTGRSQHLESCSSYSKASAAVMDDENSEEKTKRQRQRQRPR